MPHLFMYQIQLNRTRELAVKIQPKINRPKDAAANTVHSVGKTFYLRPWSLIFSGKQLHGIRYTKFQNQKTICLKFRPSTLWRMWKLYPYAHTSMHTYACLCWSRHRTFSGNYYIRSISFGKTRIIVALNTSNLRIRKITILRHGNI